MSTYAMVLVGCDGSEFGFGENESAEVFRLRSVFRPLIDVNDVESRLVTMHRVQADLWRPDVQETRH